MKRATTITSVIIILLLITGFAAQGQTNVEPELEVLYFGFEDGVNRASEPCRILAHLINNGGESPLARFASLKVSPGITIVSSPESTSLANVESGRYMDFIWEVTANQAGLPYEITLQVTDLGDLNGDGTIETVDLATLSGSWLTDTPAYDIGAAGADGFIDLEDFDRLAQNWGNEAAAEAASVSFTAPLGLSPETYVPVPQAVSTDVDICAYYYPCWYKPQHWDLFRKNAPNRKPLLGYYDESNPECVDWQIKWAVENGITCFLVDWYWNNGFQVYTHWFNAYKQAQYRDELKVAIMWANHNAAGSHSVQDMIDVTQEWIDNYFNLDSYFQVNGKPAIFIWAPYRLREDLGSNAAVKAALDNSQAMARAAGYNGIEFIGLMGCNTDMGFAGITSYHEWGSTSGEVRDYADIVATAPAAWVSKEISHSVLHNIPGGDFSTPYFASSPSQDFSNEGSWVYHVSWANAIANLVGSGADRHLELSVGWYPRGATVWWDDLGTSPSNSPWTVYADLKAVPLNNLDAQRIIALGDDQNSNFDFKLDFDGRLVGGTYAIDWYAGGQSGTYYSPTSIINKYTQVSIHYDPANGQAQALVGTEVVFDVTIATGITIDKVIFSNQTGSAEYDTGKLMIDNVHTTSNFVHYPVVDTGWDNRPVTEDGWGIENRTAPLFETLLASAEDHLQDYPKPFVVVGPMTEWGEGSYIEPCTEYGFDMYEAIRNVFAEGNPASWPTNVAPSDVDLGPYDYPTYALTHWDFDGSSQGWEAYMGVENFRNEAMWIPILHNIQGGHFSFPYFQSGVPVQTFSGSGSWNTYESPDNASVILADGGDARHAELSVSSYPRLAAMWWDDEGVSPTDMDWTISADLKAVPGGNFNGERTFGLGTSTDGGFEFAMTFDGVSTGSGYAIDWVAGSQSGTVYSTTSIINNYANVAVYYNPVTGETRGTVGSEVIFETSIATGITFDKVVFRNNCDASTWDTGTFYVDNVLGSNSDGVVRFDVITNDPALIAYIPQAIWLASYSKVRVTMEINGTLPNPSSAELYWSLQGNLWHNWASGVSTTIDSTTASSRQTYEFDLSSNPYWDGHIDLLRFDVPGIVGLDVIVYDIEFTN